MNPSNSATNNYLFGRYNRKFAYSLGVLGLLSLALNIIGFLTGDIMLKTLFTTILG